MPSNEAPSGETPSGETMFHLPKASQLGTHILESTAYGMNNWWNKNFAPEHRGGRTVHRGPFEAQTVGWIDDRNEARCLGITVEELETSRSVARRMGADQRTEGGDTVRAGVSIPMTLSVPSPRYYGRITGITK